MANLVQSLLNESAQTAFSDQFSVANKLTKKWAKSGLLEGLSDHDRSSMAVILENQAKQLVIETSQTNANLNSGGSTFTATNGEQWAGVALPLVRKIFGQIAAKEFVSVQPMNLPAGLVFFLDFQYGTSGNPNFPVNTSMYGAQTTNFGNAASGGLYGGGQFGYSLNLFSASVTSSNTGLFVSTSAAWSDVNFDSALSSSIVTNSLTKIAIPQSAFSGSDANAVRSFTIAPAAANAVQFGDGEVLSNFTTVSASNVVFVVNKTSPATAHLIPCTRVCTLAM